MFDLMLSKAVNEILVQEKEAVAARRTSKAQAAAESKARPEPDPEEKPKEVIELQARPIPQEETMPQEVTAIEPRAESQTVQKSQQTQKLEPEEPQTADIPQNTEAQASRYFEFLAGVSPFLSMGDGTDYFKIGFVAYFSGYYRFRLPFGNLGLGIFSELCVFSADGTAASVNGLIVPFGPDVYLAIGEAFPVLRFHLSCGPAILSIDPDGGKRLSKLVPYLIGRVGFGIPFIQAFGISFEFDFSVFFESELVIMGFTPSLYVYLRL